MKKLAEFEQVFYILLVAIAAYLVYEVYGALTGKGKFDNNGNPINLAGEIGTFIQNLFGTATPGGYYDPSLGTPGSLSVPAANCTGLGCTGTYLNATGFTCCDVIIKSWSWLTGKGYNCPSGQPPCGSA